MNIVKRGITVNDVPEPPTISEIVDRAAATVPVAQRAAFRVELRAGLERDAAARRRREALGPVAVAAIERGLASVTDGARTPKALTGRELAMYRQRNGGADPEPAAPMRGRSSFLNRGRFGGYDSPEEQQRAAARERAQIIGDDSVEEQLARTTLGPPGYGRQLPQAVPLGRTSAPVGAPVAPSAAVAIERGITAPPYAPVLRGRELMMFRQRHGRDPLPGETMDFGTVPPAAGGAR
jgi:hypothetical protein